MQSQEMNPRGQMGEGYVPFFTEDSRREYGDRFGGSPGAKLSLSDPTRRHIPRLWLHWLLALVSAVLLILLSYTMFGQHDAGVRILLVCVSILSINIIGNLMIGWRRGNRRMRGFGPRLVLAFISGILLVVLSYMMLLGNNGVAGVLVVVISILSVNIISYLTAYSKPSG